MKSMQEMMTEQAEEKRATLRPAQLENIRQVIGVARSYSKGEITIEEAEYQTVGSYFRFKVTQTLSPGTSDWKAWMRLIQDLCSTDKLGYWTDHGYFAKKDLDLGSGRVRMRTKHDFQNQTQCEIIEFQYLDENNKWQWPSEFPPTLAPTKGPKPKDEAFVKKQWEAWEFPEEV